MSNSAWATALTSTRDSRSTTEIHNTSHDHIATPATIPLIATATPAVGSTITRIEVYSGTTLISTSNGGTLNANWITLKPGTQTLTARAIDSNGGVSTASVTITVTSAANETITFIHNDLAGSPMAATDINGAIVWKEDYSPYGERKQKEAASSNQHQWFGGKVQDSETGLSYFGARYYDPVVGRFMGVDAVGFNPGNLQSFNRYAYANNNPYKYVDPDGNTSLALCAGGPPGCAVGIGLAVLGLGYSIIPAEDQQRINQAVGAGFRSAVDALRGSADGYLISVGPGPVISNSDGDKDADTSKDPKRFFDKEQRQRAQDRSKDANGNPTCEYCDINTTNERGKKESSTIDHIKAWIKGGRTTDENANNACVSCNGKKGAKDLGTEWVPPNQQ
jgi:RHS repeat-associated protein